jgi:CheY-like chemotaxis protein
MDAIGKLAGGVAHDFNNLLTVIMGYSDVMIDRLRPADPLREFVEEIRKAGTRATSLTRQLLAFSRKQILVPEVVELNTLLSDMERMLTRLIGEDIDLKCVMEKKQWKVKVDRGQMEQILLNLVVNARDAMPRGGKLTIETAIVELDETYCNTHPYAQPGPYALVSVSDTGCGMDQATRLRVFEPFFTTKGPEKGTGLGLSTVYGIVKQSNGLIEVYSELARGSTFKVFLPRADDETPKKKSRSVEGALRRGLETVLLVEDEVGVRTLARLVLEKSGYTVIEAESGPDALDLVQMHPEPIKIMLADVVMPDMSGPELAKQLTTLRPDMKVLFLSGYTDEAILRHGIIDADVPFLQKSFTQDGLLKKVREVLDTVVDPW